MFCVLVSDPLATAGLALLEGAADVECIAGGKMSRADVLARIPAADALIVRSETRVDEELLAAGKRLKVVARAGVGVDSIDVAAATARGVLVMNAPGATAVAAAEHTFALLLALARSLPAAGAALRRGEWQRARFQGVELHGKTLGVIGFGRIGQLVAERARAFGMSVLAHSPRLTEGIARERGVRMAALDDLLAASEFVTLHAALTPATRHLINARTIARMKDGARLINTARGDLVDEAALFDALRTGKLAGAALDVFAQEPPGDSPLLELDNVVATPHLAGSTVEAQHRVAVQIVEQVLDALRGVSYRNTVNGPREV